MKLHANLLISLLLAAAIAQGANITHISGGSSHTLMLNQDGRVWACGLNSRGQLGIGSYSNVPYLVQVSNLMDIAEINGGYNNSFAVKNDGTVWAWGYNYLGQLGDGVWEYYTTPILFNLFFEPCPGDFDGDGLADPVMADNTGRWYVWFSSSQYLVRYGPYTLSVP